MLSCPVDWCTIYPVWRGKNIGAYGRSSLPRHTGSVLVSPCLYVSAANPADG